MWFGVRGNGGCAGLGGLRGDGGNAGFERTATQATQCVVDCVAMGSQRKTLILYILIHVDRDRYRGDYTTTQSNIAL